MDQGQSEVPLPGPDPDLQFVVFFPVLTLGSSHSVFPFFPEMQSSMLSIHGTMVPSVGFSSRSNTLDLWWDVTIDIEDLNGFLQNLSGSDSGFPLFVRDSESDFGWRPWTDDDSCALRDWVSTKFEEQGRYECFNQKQLSERLGVSVPKVTEWLRRADCPLPHIKNGRVILVPAFMLEEWMREEAARSVGGR